jgi:hypothetical protein
MFTYWLYFGEMSLKGSCAEGLVPSPWHYWEVVGPSGRKLGHWRHALERDIGTLPLFFFLCFPAAKEANRSPLPCASPVMYCAPTVPSDHGLKSLETEPK